MTAALAIALVGITLGAYVRRARLADQEAAARMERATTSALDYKCSGGVR